MRWVAQLYCWWFGHAYVGEQVVETSGQPGSKVWASFTIEYRICSRCGEVEL